MMYESKWGSRFVGRCAPFFERIGLSPFVWRTTTYGLIYIAAYYIYHQFGAYPNHVVLPWASPAIVVAAALTTALVGATFAEKYRLPFGFMNSPPEHRRATSVLSCMMILSLNILNYDARPEYASSIAGMPLLVLAGEIAISVLSSKRSAK